MDNVTLESAVGIIVVIVILFGYFWKKADWKAIDESNRRYYNEEGEHTYYDRKAIIVNSRREKHARQPK